ncbi:hypothetical protein L1887_00948 [Cichorium endivia]|nr:hypothetical protein L1887_00948 [Cichorium endivia]
MFSFESRKLCKQKHYTPSFTTNLKQAFSLSQEGLVASIEAHIRLDLHSLRYNINPIFLIKCIKDLPCSLGNDLFLVYFRSDLDERNGNKRRKQTFKGKKGKKKRSVSPA